jgi:hypothetical protein
MPKMKWFAGSLLALIILAFFAAAAMPAAVGTTKTISLIPGWYLLAPPFAPGDPPGPLQLQAPISRWTEMDSTETAAGCEEQRNNMMRMYRSADITSTAIQFKLLLYHDAVCVSSADPRLKVRRPHRDLAQGVARLTDGNFATSGFAGPPVQRGSDLPPDSSSLIRKAEQANMQISVPMMLFGLAVIATVGSLCGWLLEPGRAGRPGAEGGTERDADLNSGGLGDKGRANFSLSRDSSGVLAT